MASDLQMRRGVLLSGLAAQYPGGLAARFLTKQFAPMYAGEATQLVKDLAYLVERGFIRRDVTEALNIEVVTYTCTADGLLVAEGSTKDAGVEVEPG